MIRGEAGHLHTSSRIDRSGFSIQAIDFILWENTSEWFLNVKM